MRKITKRLNISFPSLNYVNRRVDCLLLLRATTNLTTNADVIRAVLASDAVRELLEGRNADAIIGDYNHLWQGRAGSEPHEIVLTANEQAVVANISNKLSISATQAVLLACFAYLLSAEHIDMPIQGTMQCPQPSIGISFSPVPLLGSGMKNKEQFKPYWYSVIQQAYLSGIRVIAEPYWGFGGVQPMAYLTVGQRAEMQILGNDIDTNKMDFVKTVCSASKGQELKKLLCKLVKAVKREIESSNWDEQDYYNPSSMIAFAQKIMPPSTPKYLLSAVTTYCSYWQAHPERYTIGYFRSRLDIVLGKYEQIQAFLAAYTFYTMDAFAFIRSIQIKNQGEKMLLIVDPPYLFCKGNYMSDAAGYECHEKLARLLNGLKKENDIDFVVCFRITGQNMKGTKGNTFREDLLLPAFYHHHYGGRGYYSAAIQLGYTVEAMITTLNMSSSLGWLPFT